MTQNTQTQKTTDKKGHATPKRKEAQAKNYRPLVVDKKEAKARRKLARQKALQRQQEALNGTGDPRYLPLIDQGVTRKYIRDWIDSRVAVGELLMPAIFIFLILSFVFQSNPTYSAIMIIGMWSLFALGFVEVCIYTWLINRQLLKVTDGNKIVKSGNGRYVMQRLISPRFLRRPRTQKRIGQKPNVEDYAAGIRSELR